MSEPQPTPSSELLRLQRYGLGIGLALLVAIASFFQGGPLELIFLRVMVVPLFVMTMIGIGQIFSSEASRTPWTIYFLERKILEGLGIASFLSIALWQPTATIGELVAVFLAILIVVSGVSMLYEGWRYGRRKRDT